MSNFIFFKKTFFSQNVFHNFFFVPLSAYSWTCNDFSSIFICTWKVGTDTDENESTFASQHWQKLVNIQLLSTKYEFFRRPSMRQIPLCILWPSNLCLFRFPFQHLAQKKWKTWKTFWSTLSHILSSAPCVQVPSRNAAALRPRGAPRARRARRGGQGRELLEDVRPSGGRTWPSTAAMRPATMAPAQMDLLSWLSSQ